MVSHQLIGEHFGLWWLAGEPSRQVQGMLLVNERGEPRLSLFGVLGIQIDRVFDLPKGQFRILGELETMTGVTLENCVATGLSGGMRLRRQHWHVGEAVFGAHFQPNESWAFYGATFQMPLVTNWLSQATTEQTHEWDESGNFKKLSVAVSLDSWPLWDIEDGEVALIRAGSMRQASEGITELQSRIDLRIRRSALLKRDEMHVLATRPLQVLIGLATGQFSAAQCGSVFIASEDKEGGRRSFEWVWHPHEVARDAKRIQYGFGYGDLVTDCGKTVGQWLRRQIEIEPVVNLYLASLRNLGYTELSFLLTSQALEILDRQRINESLLEADEWRDLAGKLTATIAEAVAMKPKGDKIRDQLVGKMSQFNEPGLGTRLKRLINALGDAGIRVADGNVALFIRQVVDSRNYYTHWSAGLQDRAFHGEDLVHATSRLMAIVELHLLVDVGFAIPSRAADAILYRRVSWLPSGKRSN